MSILNSYATLAEFKAWKEIESSDAMRDGDVERILEAQSRFIDDKTFRTFYPRIETRYYDIPDERCLRVDDDLLQVLSLTNGNGSTIAAAQYNLEPKNLTPYYEIKLKELSAEAWMPDSTHGGDRVVAVYGYWGFHNRYAQRAWKSVGTLGAAISDTTTAAFTMTAGHAVAIGRIYRIDNELYNVTGVSGNTITPYARGDNGSTAATHSNSTTVYEWQVIPNVKVAVLDLAHAVYARRFGTSANFGVTVTAAGVVLSPKDYSESVKDTIASLKRMN
jgi:hypothetical protein